MAEENQRKRKWFENSTIQHGSRNKRGDLGRGDWSRARKDRRSKNEDSQAKRRNTDANGEAKTSVLPAPFAAEEIEAEERKPKVKVAVLLGYSGTGYKGMQIAKTERTIEGDLFTAFVKAGAISKANADDPKKSTLVRCARTDKGVHAAGNIISLKLIAGIPDIVQKINEHLSPQIRVWGILRTVNSFSCYQACDSRWYEYLIPTHSFLPPHPSSYLGKNLPIWAEEADDLEGYKKRQHEVSTFWDETEEKFIKPILDELEEPLRSLVMEALYDSEEKATEENLDASLHASSEKRENVSMEEDLLAEGAVETANSNDQNQSQTNVDIFGEDPAILKESEPQTVPGKSSTQFSTAESQPSESLQERKRLESAIKRLRNAYMTAKREYRIPQARMDRIALCLKPFLGVRNFHNYTVQKQFKDPSARRNIKSFTLDPKPIIINGTEWVSLKIHGQSFMMHQIRKMVGMIALIVRCGRHPALIQDSFLQTYISIPKVPGLGLLLERPVFETYSTNIAEKYSRPPIDFSPFEQEITEFKQREIYERIFREEEEGNAFHTFFTHVDNLKEPQFAYLSSKGIEAVKEFETKNKGKKGKGGLGSLEDDEDGDMPVKGEGEG